GQEPVGARGPPPPPQLYGARLPRRLPSRCHRLPARAALHQPGFTPGPTFANAGRVIHENRPTIHVISQGGASFSDSGQVHVTTGGIPIGPQWGASGGPYFFGADQLGRDVGTRLLYGGRNSLVIGITSAVICTLAAIILALLAAYFGGATDWIISRAFDLIWAFPVILLGIALGTSLNINGFHHGPINIPAGSLLIPIAVIAFVFIPYIG